MRDMRLAISGRHPYMEQKDSQLRDSLTISPRFNRQREATIALMWNLFLQFLCYFHYDLLCYTDHPDLH